MHFLAAQGHASGWLSGAARSGMHFLGPHVGVSTGMLQVAGAFQVIQCTPDRTEGWERESQRARQSIPWYWAAKVLGYTTQYL